MLDKGVSMRATTKFIYALYYYDFDSPQVQENGPNEVFFYIGRTTNPERRLKQHQYKALRGTEDNYVFIRELNQKNKEWDMEVLREVMDTDNRPWEYWYVIESIRKGSPLKNMRYGDFQHISTNRLKEFATDKSINDIDDLKKRIDKEEADERSSYRSSSAVQLKATERSLRFLREESEERSGQTKKWKIYDLGEGTEEVKAESGLKEGEIAALITPDARERMRMLILECDPLRQGFERRTGLLAAKSQQ